MKLDCHYFSSSSELQNQTSLITYNYSFSSITDAYLGGICNAITQSGCIDENAECNNSICQCIVQFSDINGTCKAGIPSIDKKEKTLSLSLSLSPSLYPSLSLAHSFSLLMVRTVIFTCLMGFIPMIIFRK